MGDPNEVFNNVPNDPFGPYQRQEDRIQDVAGAKMATRELYSEIVGPDGIRQICAQTQYTCQGCGGVFVMIGVNGSIIDNIIMCERCIRAAKWKYLLKPIWGLFVKTDGK